MTLDTVLVIVITSLGIAAAVWWFGVLRRHRDSPDAAYRRDIRSLRRRHDCRATAHCPDSLWDAGSLCEDKYSRDKQAIAWVAIGSLDAGCGGCGCGG
jgi:hypothetical protein